MIYQGGTLNLDVDGDGVAELCFHASASPVNKFDAATLAELREAVDRLRATPGVRGLMLTSALDAFVVGADVKRFADVFSQPAADFERAMRRTHRLFADIEDLAFPTVAAIGGLALGGGFEVCLACDYRVMAGQTQVGLPEIGLGIFPGWGGSMRLPRLIGVQAAADWIADGRPRNAQDAHNAGAVDHVTSRDTLHQAARALILGDGAGEDMARRRALKVNAPLPDDAERAGVFDAIRRRLADRLDPDYPALDMVLDAMARHTGLPREDAMGVEIAAFVAVARTPTAASLVGLFLNDQHLKKQARRYAADAPAAARVGVLGSGIMGGGIALQCALKGIDVVVNDASASALKAAMSALDARLDARVKANRLSTADAGRVRARLHAAPDIAALADCDLVIEAVVEDRDVKIAVLSDLDARLPDHALMASNTSTLAIDGLAASLNGRARFVGLHFFNPATAMALVEVVRGAHCSESALARAVAFAQAIGKHPVVVRDGPGFLVNRVLFPYLNAFERLVHDGVGFARVDRVMEAFGWPMGPARLIDAVGIDTTVKAGRIMAEGFADRMAMDFTPPSVRLHDAGRLGVKSGAGYYRYQTTGVGRPERAMDPGVVDLLGAASGEGDLSDDDIVARLMTPLCIELARCLEEGVVDGPEAADMALIHGLGFPRHIGGALRYVERFGAAAFCDQAARFDHLGAAYRPGELLRGTARSQARFFQRSNASPT